MKYFFLMLISLNCFAETYEVSHRGHIYKFAEDEKGLILRSERLSFEIPAKPCSKALISEVKSAFEDKLKLQTTSKEHVLFVKSSKKTLNIPEGHKNGKYLTYFPDHFAKYFLVYKGLCK